MVVVRWNGERPSTAAYSVAPSDHRSDSGPGRWPLTRSGATYSGEPTMSPVRVNPGEPSSRAMPKSVSTTRPPRSSRTLAGFTSRCSTPCRCASSSAPSTWPPTRAASRGSRVPSESITSASERPSISSITIHGRPSCSSTSYTVTTPRCLICAAARASCCIREPRVRSSASGMPVTASSFTATRRCSLVSSATQTVPIPPLPRRSPST